MRRTIFFGLLICLIWSCKSTSKIASEKRMFSFSEVVFGQGGGFSGKVKQFCLNDKGEVSSIVLNDTIQLKVVNDSVTIKCFERVEQLHLEVRKVNEPGNLYYFIKYNNRKSEVKAVWGNQSKVNSDDLKKCYDYLRKVCL